MFPGSSVGPPVDYNRTPGNAHPSALRDAIFNVLSLGEYQHPGSVRQGLSDQLHSMDPRTPTGAVNLAGILMGKMTPGQGEFLNSIRASSLGRNDATFNARAPGVATLARHTGTAGVESPGGWRGEYKAQNPMFYLNPTEFALTGEGFSKFGPNRSSYQAVVDHLLSQIPGRADGQAANVWSTHQGLSPSQMRLLTERLFNHRN